MKLLSIVIANYNYGRFVGAAIRSVIAQDCFDKCELIVIDGGSSDNSVEIIKQYESQIAYWVSEKDAGQSNAFNKGIAHSNGRFLTWLNADDVMLPGTLKVVLKAIQDDPDVDWLCGNFMRYREDNGRIIEAAWGPHIVPKFLQGNGFPIQVFGPTTFWSRRAYEAVGPIDESFHYIMDSEYWERLLMAGYRYVRINHCCWAFRMHVDSKTAEFGAHKRSEKVYKAMMAERRCKQEKTRFSISRGGRYLIWVWRLLDGSAFVALWRRFFIVGKSVSAIYLGF